MPDNAFSAELLSPAMLSGTNWTSCPFCVEPIDFCTVQHLLGLEVGLLNEQTSVSSALGLCYPVPNEKIHELFGVCGTKANCSLWPSQETRSINSTRYVFSSYPILLTAVVWYMFVF